MSTEKRGLLESSQEVGWRLITEEEKKEFHEKQMERIGDKVEEYIEKERRGWERARTRLIG